MKGNTFAHILAIIFICMLIVFTVMWTRSYILEKDNLEKQAQVELSNRITAIVRDRADASILCDK